MSNVMKWSGSKDTQAESILKFFPKYINTYYEPFLGGGSVFLKLLESNILVDNYMVSDINKELIGIYKMIQDDPEKLIETYRFHYNKYNSADISYRKLYFNEVREYFNQTKLPEDFYWIMRTTTNGMPRYNKKGEFNNSCHFSRPGMNPTEVEKIINDHFILFNTKKIKFLCNSYNSICGKVGDLIYMDPPYQNTKGMYFGGFDNNEFIDWANNLDSDWIMSYDGKVNDEKINHIPPNHLRHEYLLSGNSSFRRVIGKSKDSIISESLYLNF